MKKQIDKCYMCDEPGITKEHVPPQCIFPEGKDTNGIDYRKNLITVPSCEEHNLHKSQEDQYLLLIFSMVLQANEIGQSHFHSKGVRTLKLDKKVLLPEITVATPVYVNNLPSIACYLDKTRFERIFHNITLGIYYHHYKQRFVNGNFRVYPLFIFPGLLDVPFLARMKEVEFYKFSFLIKKLFETNTKYGDNPEVFYYQIHEEGSISEIVFRFVFYGGIEIITSSFPVHDEFGIILFNDPPSASIP